MSHRLPPQCHRTGLDRGLTLTELLVTIAVIGLLASILLPAVGMVRDSARTQRCQSAQRQVFLACTGYATDHRGGLPATRLGSGYYWFALIASYAGTTPQGSGAQHPYAGTVIAGCPRFTYDTAMPVGYSYGINAYLNYGNGGNADQQHNRIGGTSDPLRFTEFNLGAIERPATRLYLQDRSDFWTGSTVPTFPLSLDEMRHRGRNATTFVDGHGALITAAASLQAQTGN